MRQDPKSDPARAQTFVAVQPLGATTTVNDATVSDFGTAMPTPNVEDPYAAFGLASPDELALGVEINDLLKWIGTYVFMSTSLIVVALELKHMRIVFIADSLCSLRRSISLYDNNII